MPRAPRARAPAPQPAGEEEDDDKAYRKAIEDSELEELARWPGLPLALAESAGVQVAAPLPALEPEHKPWPLVGHSWSWTSTSPCTPELVRCTPEWVGAEQQQEAAAQPAPAVVPWLYPWPAPVYIDLTDEDNGDGH